VGDAAAWARCTLNVGIVSYDEMKSRTKRIARGKQRVSP
jgi:hypothetical protein